MSRIKCFLIKPTRKKIPREIFSDETGEKIAETEDTVWQRVDTGEEFRMWERPVGAMWFAPWYNKTYCKPQLKHVLVVHTPGGDWVVDSRLPTARCLRTINRKNIIAGLSKVNCQTLPYRKTA